MDWVPSTESRLWHWSWHSFVFRHLSHLQASTALLYNSPASPGFPTGSYCPWEHHSGTNKEGGPDTATQKQSFPALDMLNTFFKRRQMFIIRGVFCSLNYFKLSNYSSFTLLWYMPNLPASFSFLFIVSLFSLSPLPPSHPPSLSLYWSTYNECVT